MPFRTITISTIEQYPRPRTFAFLPDFTCLEDDLLLNEEYIAKTDESGEGSVELPTADEGTIHYRVMMDGKGIGNGHLEAGPPMDLADFLLTAEGSAPGGGGGGGGDGEAVWGGITGSLPDQTDLQAALNAKQATLVSGTNIKTVESSSLVGSGNLLVLPSQAGNSGRFLSTNGTVPNWATITSGAMYVENFANVQAALDAFAASSAKVLIFGSGGTYNTTATLVAAALTDKVLEGNNAKIVPAGGIAGFRLNSCVRTTVRNLQVEGLGTDSLSGQTGIILDTCQHTAIEGCRATNLYQGVVSVGSSAATPNSFYRNNFIANGYGMVLGGEYDNIIGNSITGNVGVGVKILAGNSRLFANSITNNLVGIECDSISVPNGDHGMIMANSINHNLSCGIYLKNLIYSMSIENNEIWANFGGANLAKGSTYGIYLENVTGVRISANTIARNYINIGIDGITRSSIQNNLFLADPVITATRNHIIEYVGPQQNTYRIGGNVIGSLPLTPATTPAFVCPNATFDDPPIYLEVGDETTALTVGPAKKTFRVPYGYQLAGLRAGVSDAPTGANLIVDLNKNGTSILSTKLSVDAGEKTSTTAVNPAIISDHDLPDDSEVTVDIDQIGSTNAGKGLKLWLVGYQHTATIPDPGWTPADLPSGVAWYDASKTHGLADSDPVSMWDDGIGHFDASATGTARPLYRTGGGSPYISFDGVNHYLNTGIDTQFGDFAVFLVFRAFNMTEAASRIIDKRYDTGFWIGTDASGTGNLGGGIIEPTPPLGHFYTAAANTWYAMLFQRSGTTKTIRFAGSSNTATVSNAPLSAIYQVTLGGDSGGGGTTSQVDFKEIVFCNDDIAGADLTNLIAYALSRHGLTL